MDVRCTNLFCSNDSVINYVIGYFFKQPVCFEWLFLGTSKILVVLKLDCSLIKILNITAFMARRYFYTLNFLGELKIASSAK